MAKLAVHGGKQVLTGGDLGRDNVAYVKGTCPYGKGESVTYNEEDFVETRKVTDDSIIIGGSIFPPNGIELMGKYIEAFQKLWDNLDEVLDVTFKPDENYLND